MTSAAALPPDMERPPLDPSGSPLFVRRRVGGLTASAVVVVAGLVILVSALIAADGDVPGWERDLLVFLNDLPDWLEPAMWVVQQPGVLLAPVIVGLVVVWFTREWRLLIPFVAVLPLKLVIEKVIVKQLVERERPFVSVGPEIEVRGSALDGPSFPSGHTTTAFALFILVSAFVPHRWRFVPLAGAVLVAVARLYQGEHNFLDVVAGAAMGTAFATVLWFAFLNRWARP